MGLGLLRLVSGDFVSACPRGPLPSKASCARTTFSNTEGSGVLVNEMSRVLDVRTPARAGELARSSVRTAQRTIPARAGRTSRPARRSARSPDHPRSRGENVTTRDRNGLATGPPPLARGERPHRRPRGIPGRTTPARAGRTTPGRCPNRPNTDHPRSRGENRRIQSCVAGRVGPPPLARGERPRRRAGSRRGRTTPARAGRTNGARTVRPRRSWTTPARAGRTSGAASPAPSPTDHPRSRGENTHPLGTRTLDDGPPPLARGEPGHAGSGPIPTRTTPARAGRTLRDLGLCQDVISLRYSSS